MKNNQYPMGRTWQFEAGEVLNIFKPSGLTSFDVVRRIRNWSKCRKVGHAGTLDPMATGVLIICTGRATKRVCEIMDLEKEYIGVIELGKSTDTDDYEGKILFQTEVPRFTQDDIITALGQFEGDIYQVPPMYSAIKYKGRKLYQLARQGIVINREPRNVTVYQVTLLDWINPNVRVLVRCSRGTYIRALARDLGIVLKTGGVLKELCRTRIGSFSIKNSLSLKSIEKQIMVGREHISSN
jgi:tRNA pseudouridine55 synthase